MNGWDEARMIQDETMMACVGAKWEAGGNRQGKAITCCSLRSNKDGINRTV